MVVMERDWTGDHRDQRAEVEVAGFKKVITVQVEPKLMRTKRGLRSSAELLRWIKKRNQKTESISWKIANSTSNEREIYTKRVSEV